MSDHKLAEALRECAVIRAAVSNDDTMRALVRLQRVEMAIKTAIAAHSPNPASGTSEQQAGEAVAYALLFPGDPRLCLSTVFDTYTEAINYAVTRVSGPAEIVPLFTRPQQPLTDRQLRTILTGSPTGYITDTVRGIAVDVQNALLGITKDTK